MPIYNRKLVFFIACAGMLLFGVTLITLGAILPDLKLKFKLDEQTSGTLFALLPFGILAGSVLFGYFCDNYGYKWLMVICCMLIVVGVTGIAQSESLILLQAFTFIFGLGGGAVNGATNALVADISDKNKGANLALLGVFFAIGALGVPLVLGVLKGKVSFELILLGVAAMALLVVLMMLFVSFPPAKNLDNVNTSHIFKLFNNSTLLFIALFLFFQSSLEAIVHNWITSYLIHDLMIAEDKALYALTLNVIGMAVMRLLIGSVFRSFSERAMLWVSIVILIVSSLILFIAADIISVSIALTLLGAGLAAGFPMMYSIVGKKFAEISATAFSFILSIALIGNMLINYLMGIIAKNYGIGKVLIVVFAEVIAMTILCAIIFRKQNKAIPATG